jgi:ribosomal protein S18 acetylase RimI-like enzyme
MKNQSNSAVLDPPSTGLDLEPARWDDMSDVVEIIRSSASWYEDIVEPEDFSEHLVDQDWARKNFPRRDFFVARLGDEVVGTVTLQDAGRDHVYLGYVYLHEDQVGNGFGRDLLDFARSETRRRGRESMVLIAHPEATWACRAYEKYGFEVIARSREEILAWEDGWLEPFHEEGFHLFQYRV